MSESNYLRFSRASPALEKLYRDEPPWADYVQGQPFIGLHISPEAHLDVLPFDPPAHASTDPVHLTTMSGEGYDIEVKFLSGGFLHLSIDLNIVMKGEPVAEGGRAQKLEFWGIWQK